MGRMSLSKTSLSKYRSRQSKSLVVATTALSALTAGSVYAAGFEKALLWSGRNAGQAGAVVGDVTGSESLFFNPAGLATGRAGGDVSGNISPTYSRFKGTPSYYGSPLDSKAQLSPVGAVMAQYSINPRWGFGVGYYVSGGTKASYEGIDYSTATPRAYPVTKANMKADLAVTEFAIGTGYEVLPGLKVGGALRMVHVAANLSSVSATSSTLTNVSINDIKATRYNAIRLGAQYAPSGEWGLGVNWRSEVNFIGKGTSSGTFEGITPFPSVGQSAITGGDAKVASTFPMQIALGGFSRIGSASKVALEYDFSQYAKDRVLGIEGTVGIPVVGNTQLSSVQQSWRNMHNVRLGYENTGLGPWVLRAGYIWTSQVTPTDFARATFSSPGSASTFVVGTGTNLRPNFEVNGALEYSTASGSGTNTLEVQNAQQFSSKAYVAHLGAAYKF